MFPRAITLLLCLFSCCSTSAQQPGPTQTATTVQSSVSSSATTLLPSKYPVEVLDLPSTEASPTCLPRGAGSKISVDSSAQHLLGEAPSYWKAISRGRRQSGRTRSRNLETGAITRTRCERRSSGSKMASYFSKRAHSMEPILELATRITSHLWLFHELHPNEADVRKVLAMNRRDILEEPAARDYSRLQALLDL